MSDKRSTIVYMDKGYTNNSVRKHFGNSWKLDAETLEKLQNMSDKDKQELKENSDYRLTVSANDIAIIIPSSGKYEDVTLFYKGRNFYPERISFLCASEYEHCVAEVQFSKTKTDGALKRLLNFIKSKKWLSSNLTASIADGQLESLLK